MALGANRADIVRSVLGASLGVTVIGLAVGVAAAGMATRLMSSLLFGIEATDPLTFASVVIVLTLTALVASLVPARRAARLDPTITLRK